MPRKKRTTQQKEVQDYRHDTATRKNNPPAGIAAQGKIRETPKQEYAYNPHLPPNLRSDPNGDADKLPDLLQIAQQRPLSTPMKRKPSLTHSDTTVHGSNGPANRRPNRSPSIPLRCISTNACQYQSHLEGRRTPKRPARTLRRPAAGVW